MKPTDKLKLHRALSGKNNVLDAVGFLVADYWRFKPVVVFYNKLREGSPLCCLVYFIRHWYLGDLLETNAKRKEEKPQVVDVDYILCERHFRKL